MTRDHPTEGFTRWFAWYRVPVTNDKTAWLCFVERAVYWNGTCAFWAHRMPQRNKAAQTVSASNG